MKPLTRLPGMALVLASCAQPPAALAWGKVGHAAVATIAERKLTLGALAEVQALLASEHAAHLADIALWADSRRAPGSPIHTTRIPVDGSPARAHACPSTGLCADEAIAHYGTILADRRQPVGAREEALKYIVHLVGDLHQPLHGASPVGYNSVRTGAKVKRIHAIWDNDIVEHHAKAPAALAWELMTDGQAVQLGGTPRDWAIESSTMARDHIFDALTPCYTTKSPRCPVLERVPTGYAASKYPLAAQRLKQAGYRLAALLNSLLA